MSIFGWSLPPGCGKLPGEEDEGPCQVCGFEEDRCVCFECSVCGETGNPDCYTKEGCNQEKLEIQKISLELHEKIWEAWAKLGVSGDIIMDAQQILYQVSPDSEAIKQLKELFNVKD